jgi:hypothetical protein
VYTTLERLVHDGKVGEPGVGDAGQRTFGSARTAAER